MVFLVDSWLSIQDKKAFFFSGFEVSNLETTVLKRLFKVS